jgi:hypothetical protein
MYHYYDEGVVEKEKGRKTLECIIKLNSENTKEMNISYLISNTRLII